MLLCFWRDVGRRPEEARVPRTSTAAERGGRYAQVDKVAGGASVSKYSAPTVPVLTLPLVCSWLAGVSGRPGVHPDSK